MAQPAVRVATYLRPRYNHGRYAPPFVYRFDLRPPEVIFAEGFCAYGTWYDLLDHVRHPKWYSAHDGFVSLGETTEQMIGYWVYRYAGDAGVSKAQGLDARLIESISRWQAAAAQTPEYQDLQRQLDILEKQRSELSAGWVQGYVYQVLRSRYFVHIPVNILGVRGAASDSEAQRFARTLVEWVAPFRVPPQWIARVKKVRVTLEFAPNLFWKGTRTQIVVESRQNPGYQADYAYDPFTDPASRWCGLVGYGAIGAAPRPHPISLPMNMPTIPGDPGFAAPQGWRTPAECEGRYFDGKGSPLTPPDPYGALTPLPQFAVV